jgi:hypothetical protein
MRTQLKSFVSVLLVVLVALGPATARADLWGADLAPLATLVGQGVSELTQLAETLKTMRETYEETKRYVGYADDAVTAFKDFSAFGTEVFTQPQQAIDGLFPDLQYFRQEASNTGPWAQGTGELQRVIRNCLTIGSGCVEFRDSVTTSQARAALEGAFGTSPVEDLEANATDYEASVAISASSAQAGRNAVTRQRADALMKRCASGTDKDSMAACQAAAYAATIMQARSTAEVSDQLAEGNRLQAVRISQENSQRKRELRNALERRAAIHDGATRMRPPEVRSRTEGFEFFQEGEP